MAAGMFEMQGELARKKNKLAITVVASICKAMFNHMNVNNYRIERLNG